MLEAMDQLRRDDDPKLRDLDAYHQRAFDMLTGKEVAAAFDINAETRGVRDRYGRHTFGQSALLARRLVEAGDAVRHGQLRALGPPRHATRSSRPRKAPAS